MKKIRPAFLLIVAFSTVLILATGCFRPAAPDVTPTSPGEAEPKPGGSDLELTAIANSTRAAQTSEAQTAEAEPATGEEEEEEEEGEGEEGEESPAPASPTPEETSSPAVATATVAAPGTPTSIAATATPSAVAATPAPTTAPSATTAPSGATTHVVQPNDTLFSIAVRYGTTVDAIVQANGIANASQIYVGQELTIPAGGEPSDEPSEPAPSGNTYVVQPGDRLFRIALRYNMSWTRLAEYNGIVDPNSIYPGQVLKIPPQ